VSGDLALVYASSAVDVYPIIEVTAGTDATGPVPGALKVSSQHGQAVVVLVPLQEPEGAQSQEFLDRRPQPAVAVYLTTLPKGRGIGQDYVLAGLAAVQPQLLPELAVDVPGVDEQQVRRVDLHPEHVSLVEAEARLPGQVPEAVHSGKFDLVVADQP